MTIGGVREVVEVTFLTGVKSPPSVVFVSAVLQRISRVYTHTPPWISIPPGWLGIEHGTELLHYTAASYWLFYTW